MNRQLERQTQWARYYGQVCERREIQAGEVQPECLRLISRRQAQQFQILPIRWEEGYLEVATTAPHLQHAADFCFQTLTRACRMVLVSPPEFTRLCAQLYPLKKAG